MKAIFFYLFFGLHRFLYPRCWCLHLCVCVSWPTWWRSRRRWCRGLTPTWRTPSSMWSSVIMRSSSRFSPILLVSAFVLNSPDPGRPKWPNWTESFFTPGSVSGFQIRIRIQWPNWIRIQSRSGSTKFLVPYPVHDVLFIQINRRQVIGFVLYIYRTLSKSMFASVFWNRIRIGSRFDQVSGSVSGFGIWIRILEGKKDPQK